MSTPRVDAIRGRADAVRAVLDAAVHWREHPRDSDRIKRLLGAVAAYEERAADVAALLSAEDE